MLRSLFWIQFGMGTGSLSRPFVAVQVQVMLALYFDFQ